MKNFEKYKNIKIANIYFSQNSESITKIPFKNIDFLNPHFSAAFIKNSKTNQVL
jgi:hypothetical protein